MIDSAWMPTPENINNLPEPLRRYIHDLETRCGDPAGVIQHCAALEQQNKELVAAMEVMSKSHAFIDISGTRVDGIDIDKG